MALGWDSDKKLLNETALIDKKSASWRMGADDHPRLEYLSLSKKSMSDLVFAKKTKNTVMLCIKQTTKLEK